MRAEDIETLISVGRPEIAPDGSFAVFASSRPDVAANRGVGQLWRVELPAGAPRRLTRGVSDSAPRLSPDGTRLAFLRGDGKDKSQVFVVDAGGGEPVQATDAPLGVSEFAWSPDGAAIGFLARVAERGRYGSVEGLDASAEAPRRVTAVRWHANGLGYVADRPAQVFAVAAPATDSEPFYEPAALVQAEGETAPKKTVIADEARQLTTGTASHYGIAFTGVEIATIREELETERRDLRSRVIAINADGTGER